MRNRSLRLAAWQPHARAVRASPPMHDWLVTPGSLTARLVASSDAFRVRRLHQHSAVCLADEAAAIGLARPQRVWEREVLLVCDGTPEADKRIARVLWNDPGTGVMRHADAGYQIAKECAREMGLDLPML